MMGGWLGGGGSHRLALCQGPRSCRARNRETQSKDPWLRFRQKTRKVEGAPKVPLCTKYGAIPTIISGVMAF